MPFPSAPTLWAATGLQQRRFSPGLLDGTDGGDGGDGGQGTGDGLGCYGDLRDSGGGGRVSYEGRFGKVEIEERISREGFEEERGGEGY